MTAMVVAPVSLASALSPQSADACPALKVRLQKTKLCQFHMRSACKDGSACRFAHGHEELVRQPDLSKTSMCPMILNGGKCTRPGCSYAHSAEEIRTTNFCHKTTQCMWYAMGKCRNGSSCRFAHGEADSNSALTVGNARDKVVEDRAEKNKKEKRPPQQKQAKEMADPMFIKANKVQPMVKEVQATPKYVSVPPQVMGYPMNNAACLLPPPGLAGAWNMPMMPDTSTLYNDAMYNKSCVPDPAEGAWNLAPPGALCNDMFSIPQHLVPDSTNELSDLFNHIATLTEQVKRLQDSVNQTMRSDSEGSTYSGANEERVPSETSETPSHDEDNMWSNGNRVTNSNLLLLDNKLV